MRSHLALVVLMALTSAACTQTMHGARTKDPCPAPATAKAGPTNGIGIIGMSLDQRTGTESAPELFVDRVVPEGPAATAGLRAGDRILAIEGTATTGMTIADAARRLRGPTDATVVLHVARGGQTRDVTIVRVAPSDLWSRAATTPPRGADGERVRASDVAPAAPVAVPPCRQ